jgi:hypothetical protein
MLRLAWVAGGLIALIPFSANADAIQLGINGDAQIGSNYIDFGQYPIVMLAGVALVAAALASSRAGGLVGQR